MKEDTMAGKLTAEISTSLDGFVAGPNPTLEQPLGAGGELLHEWIVGLASWRESHGLTGGTSGPDSDLVDEAVAANGAVIMGRRTRLFSDELAGPVKLELDRVVDSPAATQLRYRRG
jgi:hypothetical protein